MKVITSLFILCVVSSSFAAENCYNEDVSAGLSCKYHQAELKAAVLKLQGYGAFLIESQYPHCWMAAGKGLQCQVVSRYSYREKRDGDLHMIEDIFAVRFTGIESRREVTYTSFFVKDQATGNFHRYVDHIQDGKAKVDQYLMQESQLRSGLVSGGTFQADNNIEVVFDDKLSPFPAFTAVYWNNAKHMSANRHKDVTLVGLGIGDKKIYSPLNLEPSLRVYNMSLTNDDRDRNEYTWNSFLKRQGLR